MDMVPIRPSRIRSKNRFLRQSRRDRLRERPRFRLWKLIINNGAGNLPGIEWHSREHTSSLVPFFAKGDAARRFKLHADGLDPAYGRYLDNTEMAQVLFWAFNPR